MAYVYEHLSPANLIRVLEARNVFSEQGSAKLLYDFKLICLDSIGDLDPGYTAISYAWEDSTPVRNIELIDGCSLSVSKTVAALFDALTLL